MLAQHPQGIAHLFKVAGEPGEVVLDLLRVGLDPEPAQPEDDHLQVGVEAVGRDRHDASGEGVRRDGLVARIGVVLDDDLVVDVLGRHVHQREVVRALVGQDVLLRDLVDPQLHVARELPAEGPALLLLRLVEDPAEVLEGELGVHRHEPVADPDRGVHLLAAPELVLEREVVPGQHLREQLRQQRLAQPATDLR